jgi:hypothetical protein
MATDKTFAVTGVSTDKGDTKIRFANDMLRTKILTKNGHTNIDLIDLPREMTKAEIAQYLFETDYARGRPEVIEAIQDLAKKNKVSLKASAAVKAPADKVTA